MADETTETPAKEPGKRKYETPTTIAGLLVWHSLRFHIFALAEPVLRLFHAVRAGLPGFREELAADAGEAGPEQVRYVRDLFAAVIRALDLRIQIVNLPVLGLVLELLARDPDGEKRCANMPTAIAFAIVADDARTHRCHVLETLTPEVSYARMLEVVAAAKTMLDSTVGITVEPKSDTPARPPGAKSC